MEEQVRELAARVEDRVLRWSERWSGLEAKSRSRILGLIVAAPSVVVLGIAAWLSPSPDGFGTHRQLGLAGCAVMTVSGWPCPMCGMTTTFALMAEGRIPEAVYNQPFGVVLYSMTFASAIIGLIDAVSGRSLLRTVAWMLYPWERPIAAGLLIGLFAGWLWKSVLLHPDFFGWSSG
ncbi:MAG TPA: DUF2752 domain-containing protein [Myxococcota bacterium]|nr:DUF2752 domain-containing protein [Myxococcota bacterium]